MSGPRVVGGDGGVWGVYRDSLQKSKRSSPVVCSEYSLIISAIYWLIKSIKVYYLILSTYTINQSIKTIDGFEPFTKFTNCKCNWREGPKITANVSILKAQSVRKNRREAPRNLCWGVYLDRYTPLGGKGGSGGVGGGPATTRDSNPAQISSLSSLHSPRTPRS